jgi:AAA ATPase domain
MRNPEQLFDRWKHFLESDESFSPERIELLRALVRDVREAGQSVPLGDTRDRLALLAKTVAGAVAKLSDTAEPASEIEPFKQELSKFRLHLDGMPPPSRLFVGREDQFSELDEALQNPGCRIVQVVGVGGQGKTQLVNRWLDGLQQRHEALSSVFCYSFYTFPSHTFKKVPGFIDEARTFFLDGMGEDLKNSPRENWAKEVAWAVGAGSEVLPITPPPFNDQILQKIREQPPRLLILDGLEAVLHLNKGKWRFRKGATAIKELIEIFLHLNSGFCLITTRFKLGLLEEPEHVGQVSTINLKGIYDAEGANLLDRLLGNGYTKSQLAKVSQKLQGHPVSILAFGNILADQAENNPNIHARVSLEALLDDTLIGIYDDLDTGNEVYKIGDSNEEIDTISAENDPTRNTSQDRADNAAMEVSDAESMADDRVRGVIRSYLRYFAEQGSENGRVMFQLVRLMAFFQDLTSAEALQVLIGLQGDTTVGFNDKLRNYLFSDREIDQQKMLGLLQELEKRQLIQERTDEAPVRYDTHPILRDFFRSQLAIKQPNVWRKGHKALAEYCVNTLTVHDPKNNPIKKEDILYHYRAVEHACQAEEWELAYRLYWQRIHHNAEEPGEDNYQWFAWEKYGLQSTDIRALAFFYREPQADNQLHWQTLDPDFKERADIKQQVHIRIATSLCLLSLGFLKEAGEPLSACYRAAVRSNDNFTAAMLAGLLGDRFLIRGDRSAALRWLELALERAELSRQLPNYHGQLRSKWAKLGNLFVYAGEWVQAREAFIQMKENHQILVEADSSIPQYPYTRSGYYCCDYLLTIATLILEGVNPAELGYPELVASAQESAINWIKEVQQGTQNILNSGYPLNRQDQSFNLISQGWATGVLTIYDQNEKHRNLNDSIDLLQQGRSIQDDIEQRQDLPRTLILLASFLARANRLDEAIDAVNSALAIAWEAGMKLYECDAYLVRCYIFLKMNNMSKRDILNAYQTTQKCVEDIGFNKRLPELNILRRELLKHPEISDRDLPPISSNLGQ